MLIGAGIGIGFGGIGGGVSLQSQATSLASVKGAALFVPKFGNVFQDSAGTTPAVADDPVGKIVDLTGVYSASIATAGLRPTIRHGDVNRAFYSERFDLWTAEGANGTVDTITENTSSTYHAIKYITTLPIGPQSVKIKAKIKSGTRYLQLRPYGLGSGIAYATFDVSAGVIVSTGGTAFLQASIKAAEDGYYICTMSANYATTSSAIALYLSNSGAEVPTYIGDGISSLYIKEAQYVLGTYTAENFPAYVATTTVPKSNGVGPLWLESDGVDDSLLTNFATPASGHIFMGGRQYSSTAAMRAWAGSGNASKIGASLGINTSGYPRLATHNGTTPAVAEITSPAYTPGTPCVLEGEWTPASQVVRYNGSTEASNTGAVDPAATSQFLIGARNSGTWPTVTPANYMAGRLSSIILVPTALTAAEKLILRRYAASLEGVTL